MFRWIALGVFLATLAVSAWRRWHARRATGTIGRRQDLATAWVP